MASALYLTTAKAYPLRYPFEHRSRLKYKGRKCNSTKIRTGPQLRDDVHEHCEVAISDPVLESALQPRVVDVPLPCSGSTTVSSSVVGSRGSSTEERAPVAARSRGQPWCSSTITPLQNISKDIERTRGGKLPMCMAENHD